jgi:hypothetical protein
LKRVIVPKLLGPTSIELTEMMIKTASRKKLTRMTRERVTTLSVASLVIARTEIAESIKTDRKEYLNIVPPARIFMMDWSSGFGLPTHPPSRHELITDSGFSGFRSLHGCGAAGAFNPSSTHPSVFFLLVM